MKVENMPDLQQAGTKSESVGVDGMEALTKAARRLRELSPERFRVVLNLCRAYVAAFDRPDEDEEIFSSRIAELRRGGGRPQA